MSKSYHICLTFLGDIQFDSRLLKCARSLASANYQVSVLSADTEIEGKELPEIRLIAVSIPKRGRAFFKFLSFHVKGLVRAIRIRADCYIASDFYSLPLAYIAARFRGAKLAYDSREFYSAIAALHHRRFAQRFWSFVEKRLIPSVDVIFTVNDSLANLISERYHVPRPTILLNCPPKQHIQKTECLRELLSIPRETRIVLYQGGLQSGRGIYTSLSVINRIPNTVLVFLGNGALRREILEIREKENLQNRVHVLEAVSPDKLLHYTASADIGLCLIENYGLSYYNSLPNKIFEYITSSIPTVASNFPEITKIVERNGIGITVDPENEDEIIDAIMRLLSDRDLYKRLVENCRKAGLEYTWENEERKFLARISELIEHQIR